jgi:hypothetical protein
VQAKIDEGRDSDISGTEIPQRSSLLCARVEASADVGVLSLLGGTARSISSSLLRPQSSRPKFPQEARAAIATMRCLLLIPLKNWDAAYSHGGLRHGASGVRYEIKIAPGRRQWAWVVHISPKPKQGSAEGPRRVAILAAEKMIDRWWNRRHSVNATRVMRCNGSRSLPE